MVAVVAAALVDAVDLQPAVVVVSGSEREGVTEAVVAVAAEGMLLPELVATKAVDAAAVNIMRTRWKRCWTRGSDVGQTTVGATMGAVHPGMRPTYGMTRTRTRFTEIATWGR